MTPGGGSDVNDGCGFSEVRGVIQFLIVTSVGVVSDNAMGVVKRRQSSDLVPNSDVSGCGE